MFNTGHYTAIGSLSSHLKLWNHKADSQTFQTSSIYLYGLRVKWQVLSAKAILYLRTREAFLLFPSVPHQRCWHWFWELL